MLAADRLNQILGIVEKNGGATVAELCEALDASESTVRRDLVKLDSLGRLQRVHGGARPINDESLVSTDVPVAQKMTVNARQKDLVARHAASLVGAGDLVYIDAGTTCALVAEHLTESDATYVTDSLPIAQRLLARGMHVILPGGHVKPITEALIGEEAIESLGRFHFTVGFWGTNGCDPESGFTTPEPAEAAVKRISLAQTRRPFVLCDSSKLSLTSLVTFADFEDATVLCDDVPDAYKDCPNVVKVGA